MKKLLHIWARLKRLKWREIGKLAILCFSAFVIFGTLTTLDITVTSLFLDQQGTSGIGFNYLLAAIGLGILAPIALKIERRKGYGAAQMGCLIFLIWTSLYFWLKQSSSLAALNIIFSFKYGTLFLMNILFWALVKRYIKLSARSLKFLGLLCFETLGIGLGAFLTKGIFFQSLIPTLIGIFLSVVLFKVLGWLSSIPKETFVRKFGGVQDISEKIIVDTILAISFCWIFLYATLEFQIYTLIEETEVNPVHILSDFYMIFAACTFVGLFIFIPRFWRTIQIGLVLCILSTSICTTGIIIENPEIFLGGAILFFVFSHLYASRYLSALAKPLTQGQGMRLKKARWLITNPCAFVLLGALLLTVSYDFVYWFLLIGTVTLALLFVLSGHLYGRQLVKICALRMWCGGPLMLSYPPLKQMVHQGLSKNNAAEVIYFLNIAGEGFIKNYRALLLKMLTHPAITVRLFVLNKMKEMALNLKEKRKLSELMKVDSCEEVKNMALALLIIDSLESHGSTTTWQKYKEYLNQEEWAQGACIGFLSGKGAWLNKVVDKVLKLANSEKEKENLIALSIMQARPRPEWISAVDCLLNKKHLPIIKAALAVSGKMAATALLNRLLPMLDEIRWRDQVLETLNQYGKQAFPAIEKMILSESAPLDRKKELILFLGRIPSGEGKQILLRALFNANRLLHSAIIESLDDSEIIWVHKDRKRTLKKSIHTAVTDWHEINDMLFQTENLQNPKLAKIKPLFQEALHEELARTRRLILDQISLYSNIPLAKQAVQTLISNDFNTYAGAVSCLQDILSKKLYTSVREILLYPTLNLPPKRINEISIDVFLNRFILNPFRWANPWLQSLALYGWRELGKSAGLVAVQEGLKSKDWIVLEAALSALGHLEKNKKKVEEMILEIPTRYLLKQNFEKLLEEKHVSYN